MNRRDARWAWLAALIAATGAGLVLSFLLAISTNNQQAYERHYPWLFWVNVVIASVLLLVVVSATVQLSVRVVRGRFGSRLLMRLALIFGLVGVLPGVLVYTVSYLFVSRSIESWFDVQVEGALDAGLNLGRGTLDTLVNDLAGKTRLAAERISEGPERAQPLALERLREQLAAQEVAVLNLSGQRLASAGGAGNLFIAERVTTSQLRQARTQRVVAQLEGLDDDAGANQGAAGVAASNAAAAAGGSAQPRVRSLALIPATGFTLTGEDRFLLVTQLLPSSLAANALAVQAAYREYQQRSLAREGLRRMYIGTLTLTLILAVFGAVALALAFGNRLAKPLLLLADGVREVARGDLRPKAVFSSRDELGGLTRDFAEMTRQLAEAHSLAERSAAALEGARAKLQTILDNMSAGVIVFDRDHRIDTVNPASTRILRAPMSAYLGSALELVPGLEAFARQAHERFEQAESQPEIGERIDQWQHSFSLRAGDEALTLLVRGALLPDGARLIVFDDISDLVSAQRSEAWAEVARRLAHEIKNPLTPIQLSAERLQHKLESKLAEPTDQQMLAKSVTTIVAQVQAMKQLVNEFRDYARLPAAQLVPLDLNALVGEVLQLYAAQQEAGRVRTDLAVELPRIEGDATQLRQVVHNLVQNALDAVADRPDGVVTVRTEGARHDDGRWRSVRLAIADNGPGFADGVLKRAFEPYVTTKSKGTGLGLAVVKKIADEHAARVRIANLHGPEGEPASVGAQVSISFSKWLA